MNSSRARHSDTNWGIRHLTITNDRIGMRSSAPLESVDTETERYKLNTAVVSSDGAITQV